MNTVCECTGPGFCRRHKCNKTAFYVHLCQTKQEWFDKWEAGEGPSIYGTPADGVPYAPTVKARGVGDVIARGIRALKLDRPGKAIRKAARKLLSKQPEQVHNCGCAEDQKKLNDLFPFKDE